MARRSRTGVRGPSLSSAGERPVPRDGSPSWLVTGGVALLLVTTVWIVYGSALDAPLILDDANCIEHNPSIRKLWPLVGSRELPGPLNMVPEMSTSGRPLVNLSLAINYHLGGLAPRGYRSANILCHAAAAMLVWAIVWRTLQLARFASNFAAVGPTLALLTTLVWAVHPLNSETVVYITQRTELMVGFFYLATMYAAIRYWTADAGQTHWGVTAAISCLLGAACKEVIVTAPLVVLLFQYTFLGSLRRGVPRTSWPLYLGLAASWVLLLALNVSGPRSSTAGFGLGIPASAWWAMQAKILFMYLYKFVIPYPLVIHYELDYVEGPAAIGWMAAATVLFIVAAVLTWRQYAVGFALSCVFVILAPTLVVPILTEAAAERRMYLPLIPVVAVAVVGSYHLADKWRDRARRRTASERAPKLR